MCNKQFLSKSDITEIIQNNLEDNGDGCINSSVLKKNNVSFKVVPNITEDGYLDEDCACLLVFKASEGLFSIEVIEQEGNILFLSEDSSEIDMSTLICDFDLLNYNQKVASLRKVRTAVA